MTRRKGERRSYMIFLTPFESEPDARLSYPNLARAARLLSSCIDALALRIVAEEMKGVKRDYGHPVHFCCWQMHHKCYYTASLVSQMSPIGKNPIEGERANMESKLK